MPPLLNLGTCVLQTTRSRNSRTTQAGNEARRDPPRGGDSHDDRRIAPSSGPSVGMLPHMNLRTGRTTKDAGMGHPRAPATEHNTPRSEAYSGGLHSAQHLEAKRNWTARC